MSKMHFFNKVRSYKPKEIGWIDYLMILLIYFSMSSFIFIGILNVVSVYMSIFVLFCELGDPISDVQILGIISTTLLTIIIVELYITVKELKFGNIEIKLILIIGLTAIIRHFILLISKDFSEKDIMSMIGLAVVMMLFIFGLWIVKSRNIDNIDNIWFPLKKK